MNAKSVFTGTQTPALPDRANCHPDRPDEGTATMIRFDKVAGEARTEIEKFVVRLPGGMRQAIAEVARRSRRSMNSEIVARLERSLAESDVIETISEQPMASAPTLRAVDKAESVMMNDNERRLLQMFRKLEPGKREAVLKLLD
jgi:hypothetical protein